MLPDDPRVPAKENSSNISAHRIPSPTYLNLLNLVGETSSICLVRQVRAVLPVYLASRLTSSETEAQSPSRRKPPSNALQREVMLMVYDEITAYPPEDWCKIIGRLINRCVNLLLASPVLKNL